MSFVFHFYVYVVTVELVLPSVSKHERLYCWYRLIKVTTKYVPGTLGLLWNVKEVTYLKNSDGVFFEKYKTHQTKGTYRQSIGT